MFDKYRARFAKFEEDHESVRKIKKHLQDNRQTYLVGAGCLAGGYFLRRPNVITVINEATAPTISPVFNNTVAPTMNNIGNQLVNNGGHMYKIVKRIKPDGTEELFETITDAAKELAPEYGIKASSAFDRISKVANGHLDDYKDDRFVFAGVGTR